MAAAVRLGMEHLASKPGRQKPIHMVGYSTGARPGPGFHALDAMEGNGLAGAGEPRADLPCHSHPLGCGAGALQWKRRLSVVPGLGRPGVAVRSCPSSIRTSTTPSQPMPPRRGPPPDPLRGPDASPREPDPKAERGAAADRWCSSRPSMRRSPPNAVVDRLLETLLQAPPP